jgi:PTS system ascorbate-specific IIA component
MIGILIVAHAPLASALRDCALHVFPECAEGVQALDIAPNASPEESLVLAKAALAQLNTTEVLLLSDVFGATPSNVAQKLNDGIDTRMLAGVNLPMLLRSVCYRHETLDALAARAQAGGSQGIMPVGSTAPQNQSGPRNASSHHDH